MIQLQVLNYILDTKDASIITLNNLSNGFFSDYKGEYDYIVRHLNDYGNVCDKATFLSVFPNFEVLKVEETPSYLIKELYRDYNTRNIATTFNKSRELLLNGKYDEALELYVKSSENISSGVALQCVDILKDTSRYDDYIERTQDFNKYYISTGFKELDQVIGGFDREEELATIVARTNVGKSWALLKCATASAKQGLNVGIYSGEMSARKVGYRIDTLLGHMNNGAITHGNISVQVDYKKYIDELPTLLKGSIKVLTPTMINGPANVNALRAFIEKEHLDILFIDQLSLLEDQRNAKNPVERMSNISRDLKNLQVMKKIPLISVCQQNRTETENGRQDTTQIAQSDRIGQDSTMILFLEKKDDVFKITLGKSRDSVNGKVLSYNIDLNLGVFTYIPDENDANQGRGMEEYEDRYSSGDVGDEVF